LVDAKDDFVLRIILSAKAGVIFICVDIEALDRLQAAHGRQEVGIPSAVLAGIGKIQRRGVKGEQVIDAGDRSYGEENIFGDRQNFRTRAKI